MQFADDSIMVSGESENLQLRKFHLLRAFNIIHDNLKKLGLQLSTEKTNYMCSTRSATPTQEPMRKQDDIEKHRKSFRKQN